ncbi:unnamed protein product [Paramecium sonneborni]|uniref:Uncharacterized protein n=1 Tax=Paramecium sonneborni TaxID=65129 RepID=A0A8S1R3G2_9CILI|nr:unnamed protein product [Paramecium sonneborni]
MGVFIRMVQVLKNLQLRQSIFVSIYKINISFQKIQVQLVITYPPLNSIQIIGYLQLNLLQQIRAALFLQFQQIFQIIHFQLQELLILQTISNYGIKFKLNQQESKWIFKLNLMKNLEVRQFQYYQFKVLFEQ